MDADVKTYAAAYLRGQIAKLQAALGELEGSVVRRRKGGKKDKPSHRGMSRAARKAQGERMRKFWAARREAKKAQGGETPASAGTEGDGGTGKKSKGSRKKK